MAAKTSSASVPLIDVALTDPIQRREVEESVRRILDNASYIGGEEVQKFNDEFGAYCGGVCASVANGTDALIIALRALGVGPGDEVVVPTFTFIATAEAVSAVGASVRFTDVDPRTFTMDPASLGRAITAKTKAVIPVHIFGQPADMDALKKITGSKNIYFVEDAAQAHGAVYKGKRAGVLGDLACFSFYPTKNLGGWGDGGAVVSSSKERINLVTKIANHGRSTQYFHDIEGLNSRLDTLQAVYLRSQLRRLEAQNERRRSIAKKYDVALSGHPSVKAPHISRDVSSVYHLYSVQTSAREKLMAHLKAKDIGHGVYYPLPLHLQPAYKKLGYKKGDFPVSEKLSEEVLALPMHPRLTDEQVSFVCEALTGFHP